MAKECVSSRKVQKKKRKKKDVYRDVLKRMMERRCRRERAVKKIYVYMKRD